MYVHSTIQAYNLELSMKMRSKNYVTPKHYLDFIRTYLRLLREKREYVEVQKKRLAEGAM